MKQTILAVALLFALSQFAATSSRAFAQPVTISPDSLRVLQMAMKESMQPGPEHKFLEMMAGNWKQEIKYWPAPGSDPVTMEGTAEAKMILGGRFLQTNSHSSFGGIDTDAMSVMGFDRRHKKYTYIGFDTQGTYSVSASGTFDPESNSIVMYGEDDEPIFGFTQKYDIVVKSVDDNTMMISIIFKDEMHTKGLVPEFKVVEVTLRKQ